MARSKVGPAGSDTISEALVVLAVVVFFAVALLVGFGGNAFSGLRARVGLVPQAVDGVSITATLTVSPTPPPVTTTLPNISALQFDTPVPVLATVDAIMTAHAERMQSGEPPPATPTVDLQLFASSSTAQPSSTVRATPTLTETQASPTATRVSTSTPTMAPATPTIATATTTSTTTPDTSTVTRTSTRTPTTSVSTATGTATATPPPPPPATAPATATPALTATPAYVPPVLIGSSAGSGAIVLSWSEAVPLGSNDYFDVRVWQDGQPANGIANVQQPSFVVGGSFPAGTYNWTIAVIRKQGGQIVTLAQAGTTLRFNWVPSGTNGGGPPQR